MCVCLHCGLAHHIGVRSGMVPPRGVEENILDLHQAIVVRKTWPGRKMVPPSDEGQPCWFHRTVSSLHTRDQIGLWLTSMPPHPAETWNATVRKHPWSCGPLPGWTGFLSSTRAVGGNRVCSIVLRHCVCGFWGRLTTWWGYATCRGTACFCVPMSMTRLEVVPIMLYING